MKADGVVHHVEGGDPSPPDELADDVGSILTEVRAEPATAARAGNGAEGAGTLPRTVA